jgi:hypothetical protein
MRTDLPASVAMAQAEHLVHQDKRVRAQAFEQAAAMVEHFRMPPGDGPVLLLDVTRAIAKRLRAMK